MGGSCGVYGVAAGAEFLRWLRTCVVGGSGRLRRRGLNSFEIDRGGVDESVGLIGCVTESEIGGRRAEEARRGADRLEAPTQEGVGVKAIGPFCKPSAGSEA